ncbi:MAG: hypothetical protein AAFQ96_01140, partial [Pseudomonadota bacterium]
MIRVFRPFSLDAWRIFGAWRRAMIGVVAALAAIGAFAGSAAARVQIDITQGNIDPLPVAVPDFLGADDAIAPLGRDITGVIMSDLDRSGLFSVIDQRAYIEKLTTVNVRPKFADWRIINAQVLVVGEVRELSDGRNFDAPV